MVSPITAVLPRIYLSLTKALHPPSVARLVVTLFLLAVSLPILLVGPSAAAPKERLRWTVAPDRLAVRVLDGDRALTSFGGSAAGYRAGGREHRFGRVLASRRSSSAHVLILATSEPGRTASVTIRRTTLGVRVALRLRPAGGVQQVRVGLSAPRSAHFLGTGQRDRWVDMRGTVVPLKSWNACGSSISAPFFASSNGFGAYLEGDAVSHFAFPFAVDDANFSCDLGAPPCDVGSPVAAVRICVKDAAAAVEVYRGMPAEVVSRYTERTGRPQAPWLPHFGLIKWRDRIQGPDELFDDVDQLRSRGLPIGWVILDNPWEEGARTGCFGALTFDSGRYPDPKALVDALHARGVRLMLWISPQLRAGSCTRPPLPTGWATGDDEHELRNLANGKARADFVRRLTALAALGVDGFKGDRGDEVDLERTGRDQNAYPRLYHEAAAEAMRSRHGKWASLFRTSVPGSPATVPGFVGADQPHTWNGLSAAVKMAQTAGVSGHAMWGSDIGGYAGGELTPELFVRWAQFAALTPIFEVGGAGANARFWEMGDEAVEGFRRAATLHYELVPYLVELVRGASRTGLPAVRPLGLTWPGDAEVWRRPLEFTLGGALLAAPLTDPGGRRTLYLPAGRWIDLFTGDRYTGRRTITRTSGPRDFPLYLRRGSAIPFNFRTPALWASAWRPDDLVLAGRQGWLVAPHRGARVEAVTGAARLVATQAARRIELRLTGAAREQQLLVHASGPVCSVALNGRRLPRLDGTPILRSDSAWTFPGRARNTVAVKANVPRTAVVVLTTCA
jgi:alpha-D-xyloside xylohydrolase